MFDNGNPFIISKTNYESVYSHYWYDRLFDIALSIFHFSGELFDTCELNEKYLNAILLLRGYAAVFKRGGRLYALDCTAKGFDAYYEPKQMMISNPTFTRPVTVTNNVTGILVKNNKLGLPSFQVIKYYASLLGKLQTTLRVGLSNERLTKIFVADNDPQAQAIRKAMDDVDRGKHGMILKKSVFDAALAGGREPICYSTPANYLVDKYLADIRTILNEFYATFGINSSGANMSKAERNTNEEVHSNDEQISIARAFYLEPRQEAVERINKMFGVDIRVDVRTKEGI